MSLFVFLFFLLFSFLWWCRWRIWFSFFFFDDDVDVEYDMKIYETIIYIYSGEDDDEQSTNQLKMIIETVDHQNGKSWTWTLKIATSILFRTLKGWMRYSHRGVTCTPHFSGPRRSGLDTVEVSLLLSSRTFTS